MNCQEKIPLSFCDEIVKPSEEAMETTREARDEARRVLFKNQQKVLRAFISERVSDYHFTGSTGYGFSDAGRSVLDNVYAGIFNTESALVRHSIVSGTHALAAVMHGNLRPGEDLICATGEPYDTVKPIMGLDRSWEGGLNEWNISCRVVPLTKKNQPDINGIINAITEKTKMVFIQRSCGYTWRPSFSVKIIGEIVKAVKERKGDVITMIDNCYGEMVEEIEPTDVGADVMGGSLIKNMGGGIAPTGGYIVGRADIVRRTSNSLTCAGIGGDEGATLGHNRALFQGTFYAPHIVFGAVEGAIWAACLLDMLGFDTKPGWKEVRTDIIQGIKLGNPDMQKVFCRGIQRACPVDHQATPEPGELPGYPDKILMAGGTFIQGSSIELSCDGPVRPPYAVYLQGGICFEHIRLGVMNALQEMKEAGYI